MTKSKLEFWMNIGFCLTISSLHPLFQQFLINEGCWKTCGIKFFHPNQLPSLKKRAFHSRERTVTKENPFAPSHPRRHHLSTLSTLCALVQAAFVVIISLIDWLLLAVSVPCAPQSWCGVQARLHGLLLSWPAPARPGQPPGESQHQWRPSLARLLALLLLLPSLERRERDPARPRY